MNEIKPRPLLLIARYVAAGTLAGLLVGVLDGFYSYRFPRPRVLLRSDVSYVVLLLGPLLDGVAAGLLGLIAGLFVASRSSRCWSRTASVLGLCAIAVLLLFFARNEKSIVHSLMGGSPSTLAVAAKAAAVLLLLGAFRAALLLPVRILSKSLATAAPILLLGLGAYIVRPMRPADTAAIAAAPKGEPNVILITLDTVRADHLSLYGYSRPTTPNIDRWARQGVVFENAMAPAPWTLASHASIFTGLLPHQHGAEFAVPLDPRWWTLAEVLASRGYETAGLTANLMYGATGWGLDKGFGLYDDDSTSIRHNLRSLFLGKRLLQPIYGKYVRPDDFDRRDAQQINQDVLHWTKQRPSGPFYLFINYYDVHAPYVVPASPAWGFGHASPWTVGRISSAMKIKQYRLRLSPEDQQSLIAGYDNCLAFLDARVGELLESFSRLPGWDNTIVIITADHGEDFGEHGTYAHGLDLYRGVLHVPLIIFGSKVPAGVRIPQVVSIRDLFETILQLTGMPDAPFQQASLRRYWNPGFEPPRDDDVVSELIPQNKSYPASMSLTTSAWQYLRDAQGGEELYHWVSDPAERVNVATCPGNQAVLKELQSRLRASVSESLRPWEGAAYVAALGENNQTPTRAAMGKMNLSSGQPSRIPIGTSQALFLRRAPFLAGRPSSMDDELLQSLPYQ